MLTFITEEDVRRFLAADAHLTGAVDVLEAALRDYASGQVVVPAEERIRLVHPAGQAVRPYERDLRVLPALLPGAGAAGVRIGSTRRGRPGGTSFLLLLDFETMRPLAIIEDHEMHGVRSGATAGIAARHLAPPDAGTLGVIGCGRISRVQAATICGELPIRRLRAYSRDPGRRAAFAADCAARLGVSAEPVASAREAVEGCDVVAVATNSHHHAVLDGAWLRPGSLLVAVTPGEIDAESVRRSRVVLTSRSRIDRDYTPQEPFASLMATGEFDLEAADLLGDVLLRRIPARRDPGEITFLFSPGIGCCDLAVARWVYDSLMAPAGPHREMTGR
jgi:ornithine cyclodeaminase/alanine dehydrogenase-like protein (mu-crystallin family)